MKRTNARVHVASLLGGLVVLASTILQADARSLAGQEKNQGLFTVANGGGVSMTTTGASGATVVGYGRVEPDSGSTTPSALAIFGFRQSNVTVSEAGVPASSLLLSGRIHADVNGPVNTGLAIANPNDAPATVYFFFTDSNGVNSAQAFITIQPNGQIAAFLDQAPFNGGSSVSGTFTFTASLPVSAIALRGLVNERSDFLIATLPVVDLSSSQIPGETIQLPHFADGGGWTTQIVLVNPTEATLNGTVSFVGTSGAAATVTIDGATSDTFPYAIPPRSSRRLQTSGGTDQIRSGSAKVVSTDGNVPPVAHALFSFKNGGLTVTEASISGTRPGVAFRLYAETSGNFGEGQAGSTQTGFAITNASATPAAVNLELASLSGEPMNILGPITIPGNGQVAMFLNQIPGMQRVSNFQGVLRISTSASAGIAVAGLRGRYNERGDFLITATPPSSEGTGPSISETFFPHLADGGGYTTQFILFSGAADQSSSGTVKFFTPAGLPLDLLLR